MLDVPKLFEIAVEYFRDRADAVRSLAVTAAMERWVQFELVTLLDKHRDVLGISGVLPDELPRWWIGCEYQKHDLWIADQGEGYSQDALYGVSIELKAIHNNKNYLDKIEHIRADLTESARKLPPTRHKLPSRWGIIVATYVLYSANSHSRYQPLSEDSQLVDAARFWDRLQNDLAADAPGRRDSLIPLEIVQDASIADLSAAHYVVPSIKGQEVRLLLVKPKH